MSWRIDDLLWESVRRNEKYKSWYQEIQDMGLDNCMLQWASYDKALKRRLDSLRNSHEHHWHLYKPVDPNLSIDDIDCEIFLGERENTSRPYYHLLTKFNAVAIKINPPVSYFIEKNEIKIEEQELLSVFSGTAKHQELYKLLAQWAASILLLNKNRLFISSNPFLNSNMILDDINGLKEEFFDGKNIQYEKIPEAQNVWIGKIEESMKHLLRYDKIICELKRNKSYDYKHDGEVAIIPKNFCWENLVSGLEADYFLNTRSKANVRKKEHNKHLKRDMFNAESIEYANATIAKKFKNSFKQAVSMIRAPIDSLGVVPHKSSQTYKLDW